MSTQDNITVLEDEAYSGLFLNAERDAAAAAQGQALAGGRVRETDVAADPHALAHILRKTREAQGYSLAQMADITRVRRSYLEAIEETAYDRLPAKAFSIGYVKAYAKALGLDEETLADLFKRAFADPHQSDKLRAPVGTAFEDLKPSYRLYGGVALVLIAAVVGWNLFQHTPGGRQHPLEEGGLTGGRWLPGVPLVRGPLQVTQAAAAPKDQDVPVPYYTPGLEEGFAAIDAERAVLGNQPPPAGAMLQMRKAFNPRGAMFGAPPAESSITVQAQKSVNLVMRDNSGAVYFARQMGAGEAYRVPLVATTPLIIDVGDPKAFEVYYDGEFAGTLDAYAGGAGGLNATFISKLNAKAAAAARLMDAQMEAARQDTAGDADTPAAPVRTTPQAPRIEPRNGPIPYQPATPAPEAPVIIVPAGTPAP